MIPRLPPPAPSLALPRVSPPQTGAPDPLEPLYPLDPTEQQGLALLQQGLALLQRGLALKEQGRYQDAIACLEQARLQTLAHGQTGTALHILSELTHLHHLLENLPMAQLYARMAGDLLHQQPISDPLLTAASLLHLATLAPDIGLYPEGEELALRAMKLYEASGNMQGLCDTWLLLFDLHIQTGRHHAAAAWLQQALSLGQTMDLGSPRYITTLNKQAHLHWYRGELPAALRCIRQTIDLADATGQQKQRVYDRMVAGDLERDMGDHRKAQSWYQEAEDLARTTGLDAFVGWIDTGRVWLALLREEHRTARTLLHRLAQTDDHVQAMSVNVLQAILYSLTRRTAEATGLLQRSLVHYLRSGDPLAAGAIRLHMAANWLRSNEPTLAAEALRAALAWMAEQRIDYLPHWWHPPTMAMLCAHALRHAIEANLAERILIRHLGALAGPAMAELLAADDPAVRQRAENVLELLGVESLSVLGKDLDPPVEATLAGLLATRRLLPTGLAGLAALLMTAERRDTPNPTLVAVFGLYVHGTPRKEISARLQLSDAAVRNYINHIFKIFQLPYDPAQRTERRTRLYARALEAGYIGDGSPSP